MPEFIFVSFDRKTFCYECLICGRIITLNSRNTAACDCARWQLLNGKVYLYSRLFLYTMDGVVI